MPQRSSRSLPPAESYESHFEHSALFEFSKVINSSLELSFILSHILLTIMGKILSTRGMAVLAHGKGGYRIELVKGFPQELQGESLEISAIPHSAFELAAINARRHPWAKRLREAGVSIVLPLVIADKTVGLLAFGKRAAKGKLQAREVTYLRSLANISATAIEKAHTIAELQRVNRQLDRKIQELNTLFDLGKEFSALLDPEKLLRLLVFSLLGQIGVNRYLVSLREGADMKIVASKIAGQLPQGELLASLAKIKAPARVADLIVRGTLDPREALESLGIHVVVPIQLQGDTRGLLLLGEKISHEQFSGADLEFLSSLGNLAIISLENARLFKEAIEKQKLEDELMIAREIQKGLLPSIIPEVPGFQISAANISSKQVGGDYYDVLTLADGKHIIAIGDVSGKGSPAALLMANLQATIRALVPLELSLSELTGRVNDLLCENTGGNKFVTFFWGAIDHVQRTLRYVNAGHNYPYLLHEDGSFDRLDKGGMILGIMKTAISYEEALVQFHPHDLLVLFTDGVSEAMSTVQEEYGEERLERVLRSSLQGTSQEVLDAIHRDVLSHTLGAPQSDDITMMVVRVL
ncbi:MAG TPA: SpoIIE family protein phosphatase [Bacteroidota bacterium]|nr:SpoIIE family protein phosphatase [Bacteroidota bacterium]